MSSSYKLRINEIRKLRGLSVAELAARVGVTRAAMYRLCDGDSWPAPERWPAIADALGVRKGELFADEPLTSIEAGAGADIPDLVAA